MANSDDTFDPFGLHPETGGEDTADPSRPVLIAVSEGPADPPPNGKGPLNSTDSFDPFLIGVLQADKAAKEAQTPAPVGSPEPPPRVSRVTRSMDHSTASGKGIALPPKLTVKLTFHEEVSSEAQWGKERDGTSKVAVEGTIYAQVQCSDARKNAPFALQAAPMASGQLQVRSNPQYARQWGEDTTHQLVEIPKQEIGYVPVAYYTVEDEIQHMPILLEKKVTIKGKLCRIAVQVRSKLTNLGDMEEFTIAVAVPEVVDGDSLKILRGEGQWDDLRRLLTWKLPSLNKGESFMVSAQLGFCRELTEADEPVRFPVLLRCSSAVDQISSVDFHVGEAHGHPTSTSFQTTRSFRLLHRLS